MCIEIVIFFISCHQLLGADVTAATAQSFFGVNHTAPPSPPPIGEPLAAATLPAVTFALEPPPAGGAASPPSAAVIGRKLLH